jgi:hypothetical protein
MLSEADFTRLMVVLKDASNALKQLDAQRLKRFLFFSRTPEELRRQIVSVAPQEKLALLKLPIVRDEIRVLTSALQQARQELSDSSVRQNWRFSFSLDTVLRHLNNALVWLSRFEKDTFDLEIALNHGGDTTQLENSILVRYEAYKHRLHMSIDDAIRKNEELDVQSRRHFLGAGLKYGAVAAAFAMGIAGQAYAQETAKKDEPKATSTVPATLLTDDEVATLKKKDSLDAILRDDETIKDAPIQFVIYDNEHSTNNYLDLLQKGTGKYVVLFSSEKLTGNDRELSKRGAIQVKAMSRAMGKDVTFIYFDMNIDPALTVKNYTPFRETYQVKDFGSTVLVVYDKDKKAATTIDIKQGAPGEDKLVPPGTRNAVNYWANYLLLDKETPNGKHFKYNNSTQMQEIK